MKTRQRKVENIVSFSSMQFTLNLLYFMPDQIFIKKNTNVLFPMLLAIFLKSFVKQSFVCLRFLWS